MLRALRAVFASSLMLHASHAVGMFEDGVLRKLRVIPHRVRFMDARFKTIPKRNACIPRVLQHAVLTTISSRVRKHAVLMTVNGSLTEINVETQRAQHAQANADDMRT